MRHTSFDLHIVVSNADGVFRGPLQVVLCDGELDLGVTVGAGVDEPAAALVVAVGALPAEARHDGSAAVRDARDGVVRFAVERVCRRSSGN